MLCACADVPLREGVYETVSVEAEGRGADDAAAQADAGRQALARAVSAYRLETLPERALARQERHLLEVRRLGRRRGPDGGRRTRVRARIAYLGLGADLEKEGGLRPRDLSRGPVAELRLAEGWAGVAASTGPGAAARALGVELGRRGYEVLAEGAAWAQATGRPLLTVSGSARAVRLEDDRLRRLVRSRAELEVLVSTPGGPARRLTQDISAFDLAEGGAARRALETAGGVLGERIAEEWSQDFPPLAELTVAVLGFGDFDKALGLVLSVRENPLTEWAYLEGLTPQGARLRLGTRARPDELAVALQRRRGKPLRLVASGPGYLELEEP